MTKYKIKGGSGSPPQANLWLVEIGSGLESTEDLHNELQNMLDILLDRAKLPIDYNNSIALMEIASAFYARGCEIKFLIHSKERMGQVSSGRASKDPYYLFRTGELEDFLEACKKSIEAGSRRLSAMQYEFEQSIRGLSWGGTKFD